MALGKRFVSGPMAILPWLPYITTRNWVGRGMPIGTDMRTHGRRLTDEYGAKTERTHGSLESMFVGLKDSGKTAQMKSIGLESLLLQAFDADGNLEEQRIHIDNRKPEEGVAEWQNIVEALGCEVFAVHKGGFEVLNATDQPQEWDRLIMAMSAGELVKGKPLDINETFGMRVAIYVLTRDSNRAFGTRTLEAKLRRLEDRDIDSFYQKLDDEVLRRIQKDLAGEENEALRQSVEKMMAIPPMLPYGDIKEGALSASKYLAMLLDGHLGTMFAGTNSLKYLMQQPAVLFDMNSLTVQQTTFFETQRHLVTVATLNAGDTSATPHLHIREEMQEEAGNIVQLRAHAYANAKARASHRRTYGSTQYLGNLVWGQPGSEERMLSEQIYNGTDIFYLFTQTDTPSTTDMLASLGLSSSMIAATQDLEPGSGCYIKVDRRKRLQPELCQHHLTPLVRDLVQSNAATGRQVISRRPVQYDPRIRHLMAHAREGRS